MRINKPLSPVRGRTLGLDVSTKIGFVGLDVSDVIACGVLARKPAAIAFGAWDVAAALSLAEELRTIIESVRPEIIAIEHYAFGNSTTLAKLVEVGTLVRALLVQRFSNVPLLEVAPGSLKKYTTGKGNAKKDMMRLHVFKKWGFEHDSDDVVDAYALARYAQESLPY